MFSKKSVDYFTNMDIACIFDWDGTVVNSGRTHEFTWRELARRHGLELFPNFFEKTFAVCIFCQLEVVGTFIRSQCQ